MGLRSFLGRVARTLFHSLTTYRIQCPPSGDRKETCRLNSLNRSLPLDRALLSTGHAAVVPHLSFLQTVVSFVITFLLFDRFVRAVSPFIKEQRFSFIDDDIFYCADKNSMVARYDHFVNGTDDRC